MNSKWFINTCETISIHHKIKYILPPTGLSENKGNLLLLSNVVLKR
jgi:hypothetical protein